MTIQNLAKADVLHIIHLLKHTGHSNGNVNVAVDLACEQARAGLDVSVLSHGGFYDELLMECGVRVISLPHRGTAAGHLLFFFRLLHEVTFKGPLCVHAHMMGSVVHGYLTTRHSRSVLVSTVHNSFDKHSWLMRLGDKIVAVSESERQSLVARGFSSKKTTSILNGVGGSVRFTAHQEFSNTSTLQRSVGVLSGLHQRKAVDRSIAAFQAATKGRPDWRLRIAGAGPQRAELERQVAEGQLAGRVEFVGAVEDPMEFLRGNDILLTTTTADPCPLSVIEARLAGCAIVASRVGGIPEILGQGRNGILIDADDVNEFARTLGKLMENSDELEYWKAAAVRDSNALSVGEVSARYVEEYRDVLQNRRPRPLVRLAARIETDRTVSSIALRLRMKIEGMLRPHRITQTNDGFKMHCDIRDFVQKRIYFFGFFEPTLTEYLKDLLRPGDVVVDVGANVGYITLLAASLVGDSGAVLAIEADTEIFRKLEDNLKENTFSAVIAKNIAVTKDRCRVSTRNSAQRNLGATTVEVDENGSVDGAPLSDIAGDSLSRARLIKIDVEGNERPILEELLARQRHLRSDVVIVVEISKANGSIIDDYRAQGFEVSGLANDYSISAYRSARKTTSTVSLVSVDSWSELFTDYVIKRQAD